MPAPTYFGFRHPDYRDEWQPYFFADREEADRFKLRHFTRYEVHELPWTRRETYRFNGQYIVTGGDVQPAKYKPTIFVYEDWFASKNVELKHYAHIDPTDATRIEFTASEEHGEADRQTQMRVGKYLTKFYPELGAKKIAAMAEWWRTGVEPDLLDTENIELKFSTDFVDIYARGPQSCMSEQDCVRVYDAGDLQIAYLESKNEDGEPWIMARSICWPDQKKFGRVYPNAENYEEDGYDSDRASEAARSYLFNQLKALGYESVTERDNCLDGARIRMEQVEGYTSLYVMPYLDSNYALKLSDDEQYFVLARRGGAYTSTGTDGTCYGPERTICNHCAETSTGENFTVYSAWDALREGPTGVQTWCSDCHGTDAYYCHATGYYFSREGGEPVKSIDDNDINPAYAAKFMAVCPILGGYFAKRHGTMVRGELWSQRAIREYTFVDPVSHQIMRNEEGHTLASHDVISQTAFALYGDPQTNRLKPKFAALLGGTPAQNLALIFGELAAPASTLIQFTDAA